MFGTCLVYKKMFVGKNELKKKKNESKKKKN